MTAKCATLPSNVDRHPDRLDRTRGTARPGITRRALLAGASGFTASVSTACRTTGADSAQSSKSSARGTSGAVSVELLAGFTAPQLATLQELLVEPFQRAHPDLRLLTIDHPPAQTDQKLLTLVSAGTPPDVVYAAPPSLYRAKLTQDVTERVKRDRYDVNGFAKEGFEPAAMWKGRIVGLPYYIGGHSSVLVYNKELFRTAGLREPPLRWGAPGWDAQTWLDALRRTTTRDSAGAVRTYGVNVTLMTFYAYYLSTLWKGAWLSDDLRTVTCDSPPMIEAFDYVAALCTQYRAAATGEQLKEAFGDASAEKAFLNGQLAMYATPGAQNIAAIPPAVRSRDLPLAYAPLPAFKTFGAPHYFLANGLVAGAKQPDAGWTYMKWAADTPNWSVSRGQPPARSSLFDAWASSVYAGIEDRIRLDVLRESLRHPVKLDPLFHVPAQQRGTMTDLIQAGLERMWAGAPPAGVLRELKTQLQPLASAAVN